MNNLNRRHFLASITLPLLAAHDEIRLEVAYCSPPYVTVTAPYYLVTKFVQYFVAFQDKWWRTNPALNWAIDPNTSVYSLLISTRLERAAALFALDQMMMSYKVIVPDEVYDLLTDETEVEWA